MSVWINAPELPFMIRVDGTDDVGEVRVIVERWISSRITSWFALADDIGAVAVTFAQLPVISVFNRAVRDTDEDQQDDKPEAAYQLVELLRNLPAQ